MKEQLLSWISPIPLVHKLGSLFIHLNELIWKRLPPVMLRSRIVRRYGHFLHRCVMIRGWRHMNQGTYLIRNRPELELIHDLARSRPKGSSFRITVLGCSAGMEVYAIKWYLRNLTPLLDIQLLGLEPHQAALDTARKGEYPLAKYDWMLSRLTDAERTEFFEIRDDAAHIHPHLKQGIRWLEGDACDPSLENLLGKQDLVIANRFLCHMEQEQASACLRNITQLVAPDGHLFVSGVDLPVRQSVMQESGFVPVTDRLTEIHDGDPSLRAGWPFQTWGLEPLDRERTDWVSRYAMVYHNDDQVSNGVHMANKK